MAMPDSRPPMFDDGGGLPDVDRSRIRDDASDDNTSEGDWRGPNYLIRRLIVVAVAVAAIAGGAILVGKFLGGDDAGSAGVLTADWNRVVLVDDATGAIVMTDDEGEETDRVRLGIRSLTDSMVIDRTLVSSNDETIAVVDLDAVDSADTSAGIERIDVVTTGNLVSPSGTAQTVMAQGASSTRAIFVHAPTGDVLDTDTLDTVVGARYDLQFARSDAPGRNILVTDAGNFQSVLFSFDREAPSFFPGLALAVDGALVVTAQNVGNDATIQVFDHAGELATSVRTPSVRAGMVVDGTVILVTVDGEVLTLDAASQGADSVSTLNVGTIVEGHVATNGKRLIVVGDGGTALIDQQGAVLAEALGARPATFGIDELAPGRGECLILERADDGALIIDLSTGMIVVEAVTTGEIFAGVSGCDIVMVNATGYQLISAEDILRERIDGELVAVSPDGNTVVVDNANRLQLLPRVVADPPDDAPEPIDVGRSGRTVFFTDL